MQGELEKMSFTREEVSLLSTYLTFMSVPLVARENGSFRPLSMMERVMEGLMMERSRALSTAASESE
jgi:hypothetical protein